MEITKPRGRPKGTGASKSNAVRNVRAVLGLTQMELAVQIGCSLSAIQRMERNNTLPAQGALLDAFSKLAKLTGVSLEVEKSTT